MPLIYVTGPSGAGKSSIRKELVSRGYEAHDTDEDGISTWCDIETREPVEYLKAENRPADWLSKHAFYVSADRVKTLAEAAKDKTIFLCGIPSNDLELATYYDKVFCLVIDEITMRQRIATRETNNFGKSPDELKLISYWHGKMLERYRDFGATMIDAQRPLDVVVDEIISRTINE
ncbi:MAG: AAA family ATPase [Candidatus Saccharimonas sp.]